MENPSNYYFNIEEPNKSCLLALRNLILKTDDNISETIKYSLPCFTINKKHFCYLNIDKKTNEPYILFVDGNMLNHPELELGNRARMKILRIDPNKNIAIETIENVLASAIDLRKLKKVSL